jgi:oxygen-independent coproporphyrinogen-3 oxidase
MTPFLVPRHLLERFDVAGPRYTSYPTAPEWAEPFAETEARRLFCENQRRRREAALSLYVHLPFCRTLCWYCACSMTITRRPDVVEHYLGALEREIERVAEQLRGAGGAERRVVQIHWGGGTPTHLSTDQLERVDRALAAGFAIDPRLGPGPTVERSIEVHPPVTTREQLARLAALGFQRVSMGVQDFDPSVQEAVHRPQPFAQTAALVTDARALGFSSINIDLMYGLPRQTLAGFGRTLELVAQLRPDRLALFNYAHVPWMKPHQKLIKLAELPSRDDKLALLERAIEVLTAGGYEYIGMDHFALPESELAIAQRDGSLRRNFMGYTTCADSDVLAFGVSSISDLDDAYLQNARELPDYQGAIERGGLAIQRGMVLSADDKLRRDVINALACHARVDKRAIEARHGVEFDRAFADELTRLTPLAEAGLVEVSADALVLTPTGRLLLRNVCMIFDAYLQRPRGERRYSRTL